MTREEAIRIITGAGASPRLYKDRTEANAAILVDTLSALGVLKLEKRETTPAEPTRCEPPPEFSHLRFHYLLSPGGLFSATVRWDGGKWIDSRGRAHTVEDETLRGTRYGGPLEGSDTHLPEHHDREWHWINVAQRY